MSDIQEEKIIVAEAMKAYGGNFENCMAYLIFCADPINLQKIKTTWAVLWEKFLKMGKKL